MSITSSTLSGNSAQYGGGIFNDGGSLSITNSALVGNVATEGGGGVSNGGVLSIINSTLSGNSAGNEGGAILSADTLITITNSTLSGNSAKNGGAIFSYFFEDPTTFLITNSILWGNTAVESDDQIAIGMGDVLVNYSIVEGGWIGTGNLGDDPRFVDADGADNVAGTEDDDLHLLPDSPAIDAGDNTAEGLIGVHKDLDGKPRFLDDPITTDTGIGDAPIVDIGAFEFLATP